MTSIALYLKHDVKVLFLHGFGEKNPFETLSRTSVIFMTTRGNFVCILLLCFLLW